MDKENEINDLYDFTQYPQGFETFADLSDFLPEDKAVREGFAEAFAGF